MNVVTILSSHYKPDKYILLLKQDYDLNFFSHKYAFMVNWPNTTQQLQIVLFIKKILSVKLLSVGEEIFGKIESV